MQLLNYSLQITCVPELPGPDTIFKTYPTKTNMNPKRSTKVALCFTHTQSRAETNQTVVEPFFSTPAHIPITDIQSMRNEKQSKAAT